MVAVVAVVAADVSLDSEKIPGDGDGVSNLQPPLGAQLQLDVVDEDASIIRAGRIVHRQFIGGLVEANEGMLFAYVTLVAPTPQTQGFDFYVRAFACDAMRCGMAWHESGDDEEGQCHRGITRRENGCGVGGRKVEGEPGLEMPLWFGRRLVFLFFIYFFLSPTEKEGPASSSFFKHTGGGRGGERVS